MMGFTPRAPYYGGMMNGEYYGGMMNGYYGIMNGYYGMMGGYGSGTFLAIQALGAVAGLVVLLGAVMMFAGSGKASTWGALVLAFSLVAALASGGFFVGTILGVVGGALAMAWKPGAR